MWNKYLDIYKYDVTETWIHIHTDSFMWDVIHIHAATLVKPPLKLGMDE